MNATEIILARAEMDLCDKLNLSPNVAGRAALIVARSLGSSGWLRDPDAPATTPAASAGELAERIAKAIRDADSWDSRDAAEAALAEIAKTHDIVERKTK